MKKITTIQQLITTIDDSDFDTDFIEIIRNLNLKLDDVKRFSSWQDLHATRNVLKRTKDYELLLVCWESGQKSPLHDYDHQRAWVHPVAGKITEETFEQDEHGHLKRTGSRVLDNLSISHLDEQRGIHKYSNNENERTITLHLYVAPVDKWLVYNEETGEDLEVLTPYHTVSGFPVQAFF